MPRCELCGAEIYMKSPSYSHCDSEWSHYCSARGCEYRQGGESLGQEAQEMDAASKAASKANAVSLKGKDEIPPKPKND